MSSWMGSLRGTFWWPSFWGPRMGRCSFLRRESRAWTFSLRAADGNKERLRPPPATFARLSFAPLTPPCAPPETAGPSPQRPRHTVSHHEVKKNVAPIVGDRRGEGGLQLPPPVPHLAPDRSLTQPPEQKIRFFSSPAPSSPSPLLQGPRGPPRPPPVRLPRPPPLCQSRDVHTCPHRTSCQLHH